MELRNRKLGLFVLLILSILLSFNSFKNANQIITDSFEGLNNKDFIMDENFNLIKLTNEEKVNLMNKEINSPITKKEIQEILIQIINGIFYLFVGVIFYIESKILNIKKDEIK